MARIVRTYSSSRGWASSTHVSLPKTFDTGKASEWFQRFEICCRANGWDNDRKALKLPTLLEGEALAVWLELTRRIMLRPKRRS